MKRCYLNRWGHVTGIALGIFIAATTGDSAPPEFVPDKDFVIAAVEAGFMEMLKEFNISEPVELDLVRSAFQGKASGGVTAMSITFVKAGKESEVSKTVYEKVFNDQFTLRMTKTVSPDSEAAIAFINVSTIQLEKIHVKERILILRNNKWVEVPKAEVKP